MKLLSGDLNLGLHPSHPKALILMEWPSHQGCEVVIETKHLIKLIFCFIYDLFIINQVATIQQRGRERKQRTLKSEKVFTNKSKWITYMELHKVLLIVPLSLLHSCQRSGWIGPGSLKVLIIPNTIFYKSWFQIVLPVPTTQAIRICPLLSNLAMRKLI